MAAAANGTCSYPREQVLGTLYGQAVGDAIGLLTEFLSKQEAHKHYHEVETQLELEHKKLCNDLHRVRWKLGDWTDDTDQMVLIMQSFVDNAGATNPVDVARKLLFWTKKGYPELGDHVGMGIGDTTDKAMQHPDYPENPTKATFEVWDLNGRNLASNGGVMRTSIVGVHQYWDTDAVEKNAAEICLTSHYDHRCRASAVAASVAISLMLKREPGYMNKDGSYNVHKIIKECYRRAAKQLDKFDHKRKLQRYMECEKIKDLKLDKKGKIGYTYRCLGAGFWALKQNNFRSAIQTVVMEGGDADTNTALAGALLGCKLGLSEIPESWLSGLLHKNWLDAKIEKYLELLTNLKEGKTVQPEAQAVQSEGKTVQPEEKTVHPEEETIQLEGNTIQPEGETTQPEEKTVQPEEETIQLEGNTIQPEGETTQLEGKPLEEKIVQPEGKTVEPEEKTAQPETVEAES